MTNETMKGLLMLLMIASLLGAVQMPTIRASRSWAFLAGAMAHLRSALFLTDRTLQPAMIRRRSHNRQPSR